MGSAACYSLSVSGERHPKGSPSGGRFAASLRPDDPVSGIEGDLPPAGVGGQPFNPESMIGDRGDRKARRSRGRARRAYRRAVFVRRVFGHKVAEPWYDRARRPAEKAAQDYMVYLRERDGWALPPKHQDAPSREPRQPTP